MAESRIHFPPYGSEIHAQLTPPMRQLVERMARAPYPRLETLSAAEAKQAYARSVGVLDVPKPKLPRVVDFSVDARDKYPLPARLYAPSEAPGLPVLLYLHGGGFTIGNLESCDTFCRILALESGAAVVSLDYRLAPDHRFPTAANDAWDALQWLHREGDLLGLDSESLAVGGDSAGGTLAAVSAIEARDAGIPLTLQLLIYPGTTAHQDTASHRRFAHGPVLDKALIDWFFKQYIDTVDRDHWRFAPLNAEDLEGVAPAWIGLAECDPLVDEGVAYADKLRASRVAVDLEIYRGMVHGFISMGRAIPEARQFHKDSALALRQAFAI